MPKRMTAGEEITEMEKLSSFRKRVEKVLDAIGRDTLAYDESEFWMIRRPYEYIEYYAQANRLFNTCIALPLARGIHDGSHRKACTVKDGVSYRLPYVIHCLMVCRMLADLHMPIPKEEEDVVLASALCHDMIEDIPFEDGGRELVTKFHLDSKVYETVKLLSKDRTWSDEEHALYFRKIQENRAALLVKLSDRGNNVEDLYNMSIWKTHEYVGETRTYFFPMCLYAKAHYPELFTVFEILQDKIITLTQTADILVERYEAMEKELVGQISEAQKENARLRAELKRMMEKTDR